MLAMGSRLSSIVILLCALFFAGASRLAFAAQTYRLQTIRVVGSQRFHEQDLIAAMGLKPGSTIELDTLKQAADRLMQTGVLSSLEYKYTPLSTGLMVEYTVTDGADFLPCRYDNIVWMSGEDLTKAVHEKVPLFDGHAPTNGDLLDQVSLAISEVLVRYGIVTKIRYELHTRGMNGPVDAISFVSDTIKPKIQEVTLGGANLMTADEKLDNTKRLVGDEYNATRVRESLTNGLSFLYGYKGYLRVEVGEPQAKLISDPLQALVSVTVPVTEGAQYRWQSITWSGNTAIPAAELDKLVTFHPGDIVDHGKLDMELQAVQKAYKTKGYLAVKLQRTPSFNDQNHTVAYEIKVTEGDQYRMGSLHMTGLDPAVLDELQKKWKLKPGDPYDGEYLHAFLSENASLINGRGQAKTIKMLQSPTSDKRVDVTLQF